MPSQIATLEAFRENVANTTESFRVADIYQAHIIPDPKPNTPFDVIGYFTFKTLRKAQSVTRYFILSLGQALYSSPEISERDIAVALAETVENRWKSDGVKVDDVKLPSSHGFNPRRLNFPLLQKI